jgi:hypothetical protein
MWLSWASRVGGGWESCCFRGKKIPGEKGSVRQCSVMMQQTVLLSPKFGSKSSHIITQSPQSVTVVCRMTVWPARINYFWTIPSMSMNATGMLLTLLSTYSEFLESVFGLSIQTLMYGSRLLPWTLISSLAGPPSQDLHKIWCTLAVRGKAESDVKYQEVQQAARNSAHQLKRYASTTFCRCIARIQLLFREQHQCRKLWTAG